MISSLTDFLLVKGRNGTDGKPLGDLERIDYAHPLLATRSDRRPYGIDMAWLQECLLERSFLIYGKRSLNDSLLVFDMIAHSSSSHDQALYQALYRESASLLGLNCFVRNSELDSSGVIVDEKDEKGNFKGLLDVVRTRGLTIAEPSPDYPIPKSNSIPRADRLIAFEHLMRLLSCCCLSVGAPTVTVYHETIVQDGPNHDFSVPTLVGTLTIYREGAEAIKTVGGYQVTRETRYASVAGGLPIYFPEQTCEGVPLIKSAHVWITAYADYSNSAIGVGETHCLFVKLKTVQKVVSIGQDEITKVIETVKSSFSFNLNPVPSDGSGHASMTSANLSIRLSSVWVVNELRDAIVKLD